MMGLLGAVMLIGIVVNNAILIIDDMMEQIRNGVDEREAMLSAAKNKFQPILMTSIAAVFGIVPMAFGGGLGSELRSSCGIGIVGGLISSTILSLSVIPMMYLQFFCKKK
jgi:HAE1 family hydrophobic/amphiphilic exporter-1